MAQILMYLVKSDKTPVPPPGQMYRKLDSPATPPEKFELPFEGKLSQDNRGVMMANLIPWDEFEEEYAQNFIEPSVKRRGLESVALPWEDRLPMSAPRSRNKP